MRVPQAFALGACWPGASRVICGQREPASPFQAPGCRAGCRRVSGHLETRYLVRAAEDTARGRRWFPKQLSWTRIPGMGPEQATGTGSRRGLLGALRGRVPGRAPATDGLVGEAVSKALRGPFSREEHRGRTCASRTPRGQRGCRQRCSGCRLPPLQPPPTRKLSDPNPMDRRPPTQRLRARWALRACAGWAPGWPCRQGSHRAPLSWLVLGVLPSGEVEPTAGRRRPGTRTGRHPTRPALCSGATGSSCATCVASSAQPSKNSIRLPQ